MYLVPKINFGMQRLFPTKPNGHVLCSVMYTSIVFLFFMFYKISTATQTLYLYNVCVHLEHFLRSAHK